MKKIITLVLALVMVFALAAPALALTDAPLSTAVSAGRFSMEAHLAAALPAYGTTLTIPAVAADKAWVANELVYFAVRVTALAAYPASAPQLGTLAYDDVVLTISGNGVNVTPYLASQMILKFNGTMWNKVETTDIPALAQVGTKNAISTSLKNATPLTATANGQYVFAGIGVVTGAVGAPTITATIGIPSMQFAADGSKAYQGVAMSAAYPYVYIHKLDEAGTTFMVNFQKADTSYYGLLFTMNATTKKCEAIYYMDGTTNYLVTYGDGQKAGPDAYGTVYDYEFNGVWDSVKKANFLAGMSYLGFDYAKVNTNAVLERHFIAKIWAPSLAQTLNVPLYTASVTVPPVSSGTTALPSIPKTGDSASILGFVLIAAAIVAAAAVAYRKVRA